MLFLVILAGLALLLIVAGFVVIKLWGFAAGVKKIFDIISFFRRGERYDRVNNSENKAYNEECPICLGAPQAPVTASCNHAYCSNSFVI